MALETADLAAARLPVHVATAAEGRAMFDRRVRETLGIGGDEFIRRWDAGEFDPEEPGVMRLVMLIPFAEQRGW